MLLDWLGLLNSRFGGATPYGTIEKYGFEENIDFSVLKSGNTNGGISLINYIVTLDMAKSNIYTR
jgi:phage anti-repressor protein